MANNKIKNYKWLLRNTTTKSEFPVMNTFEMTHFLYNNFNKRLDLRLRRRFLLLHEDGILELIRIKEED